MIDMTLFADATHLGRALAEEIADGITAAQSQGLDYLLGCPGGRSPRSTYAAFAHVVAERSLDLSNVILVMMDDYVVEVDGQPQRIDPREHCSVEGFALTEILAPLNAAAGPGRGITPDRLWIPDPADPRAYDARITSAGGIDLFILASGDSDGHIAFNAPGAPRDSRTRIVELPESTRRDNLGTFPNFHHLDEVPTLGISVGIATILDVSKRAVLVAPGTSKREAVSRISAAKDYEPDWPATVLALCRHASLYVDSQSAPSPEGAHLPTRAPTGRNEVRT